jgi:hypothetical protein
MAILVNRKLLDEPVFDKSGDHRYEMPVPAAMLKANDENRVLVRIMNPWQAPDPGVRLGFLLQSVGFVKR